MSDKKVQRQAVVNALASDLKKAGIETSTTTTNVSTSVGNKSVRFVVNGNVVRHEQKMVHPHGRESWVRMASFKVSDASEKAIQAIKRMKDK